MLIIISPQEHQHKCLFSMTSQHLSTFFNIIIQIKSKIVLIFIQHIISYTMSKDQTDSQLKYGQGVLIKGYKDDDLDQGILTARGFADTGAKYQTIQNILYFKNYRNGIFELLPFGNFQINDELLRLEETVTSTEQEEVKKQATIETLRNRAQSQLNQFDLGIKSKKKDTIKFGDYVIFKHIDSCTYLSGTIRPSDGSNGAFSVEVSDKISSSIIFQLLPYRSFEYESMVIPYSSPFLIKNKVNNGFLTFQKIGMNCLSGDQKMHIEKVPTQSDDSYKIPVKTQSRNSNIYEAVTHFADLSQDKTIPMPWSFQLHFNDVNNDSLIQHDIVYLQHTQNHGILSAKGTDIILKQSKEQNTAFQFYESLWEIQKHDETEDSYILRHLMSGMTLGVKKNQEDEPISAILIDISDGPQGEVLGFVDIKLAKKEGQINSGSFIKICCGQNTLDINENSEQQVQPLSKSSSRIDELISKHKMQKLFNQQLEYDIKRLHFSTQISKHCFVIQEIDDSLKQNLLFALSFHSKIISLREDLKWGATEAAKKISYIRMMQMTDKIRQIKIFLKDCVPADFDKEYIEPIPKRQQICKDLGLSQLLFQLLFFMKENMKEEIFKQKINEKEKFYALYNACYEVIFELIRNNVAFKVHISKWLIFLFNDVIQGNEEIHFKVLKQALRQNQFFVCNFITEPLVSYLVQKMVSGQFKQQFYQIKFLEIFRSFCLVGEKVVTKNQLIILHEFIDKIKSLPNGEIYQIEFKYNEGQGIYCYAAVDKKQPKWQTFQDFKGQCLLTDEEGNQVYPKSWPYFLTYVNLLADMTQGRNKMAEHYMGQKLPLQLITAFVKTEGIQELQVPIIRLAHYLYVESQFFYPIQKQDCIIPYEEIKEKQIMLNHSRAEKNPKQYMGESLITLINRLKQYGSINPQEIKVNENLYALLLLVKETLNMGFWQQKDQVIQIFTMILNILSPHQSINYAQITATQQNNLMIACKSQCLRIIELIVDYDVDLSLQILNKVFYSFTLPQRQMKVQDRILENEEDTTFALPFVEEYINAHSKLSQNIISETIYSQILELTKYSNPTLTTQSLSILQKILAGEENRIQKFYKQAYICEEDKVQFANYLKKHTVQFIFLQEPETPELSFETQQNHYIYVYKQNSQCVMKTMYLINQLMKNEFSLQTIDGIPSLEDSKIYDMLGTDHLLNFTNQRTSSCLAKQKLVSATNIHTYIIKYITNCKEVPEEELTLKLLHLCYRFIVGLIENHQDVKTTMQKQIPNMIHHLSHNIGCVDFFKQIYDNNKIMLYNQKQLTKLIRIVCENVDANEGKFYKSKLLDLLRFFIYLNGKTIKSNQILILKIMQDDDFQNILIPTSIELINEYVDDYKNRNGSFNGSVKMSEELLYLVTYWQILTSLIDQNNYVNIGKLAKTFPFELLSNFIKASGECWPLKRNIRCFLNRIYYFTEGSNAYLQCMIQEQIPSIIADLDSYISLKLGTDAEKFESLVFQNPVRYSYLSAYHYLNLQQILFTLYSMINTNEIYLDLIKYLSNESEGSTKTCLGLIRIAERIGWLRYYFKQQTNVTTTALLKLIIQRFKNLFAQVNLSAFKGGLKGNETEEGRESLIKKILKGNITSFYLNSQNYKTEEPLSFLTDQQIHDQIQHHQINREKVKQILLRVFKRKKRQFATVDDEIAFKHEKVVKGLKLSTEVRTHFISEFITKVNTHTQNDEKSNFEFIKTIISTNAQNPGLIPPELQLFLLKFILGIFQGTNTTKMDERIQIDEWQSENWSESQGAINSLQNSLKQCRLGGFLTELMKGNIADDIYLADSILLCGISYLLGGNKVTQKNIIEQLSGDEENKVLKNIKQLIIKLGILIRQNIDEQRAIKSEPTISDFQITSVDNYDFYNQKEKKMERKNVVEERTTDQAIYYQFCIRTYRRAFKFLQLMCENNNIQNKNFLRFQPDKTQTFDFIQIATQELRQNFQVVCLSLADLPIFILDFILQVTQIPIKANQAALMKSSFFQDLCFLDNQLAKDGAIQDRGFGEDRSKIDEIYHKSVQIILSNFEGNDIKIFQSLDEKLQPKFLVSLLKYRLESLNIKTEDSLIQYIEEIGSPKINSQTGQNEVQTVFNDEIQAILEIITIFLKIQDMMKDKSRIYATYEKQKNDDNNEQKGKIFRYLESCLLKIQINDDSNQRQNIYFPNHPFFNSLSGGLRDYVMKDVERGTHRDKIVSLLGYRGDIKQIMKESYGFQKKQNISEKNMKESYKFAAIFSLVICLYMVFFYDIYIEYEQAIFTSSWLIVSFRFFLGLINFLFSVQYFYYWKKLRIWYKPSHISYEEPSESQQKEEKIEAQQSEEERKPQQEPNFFKKLINRIKAIISEWKSEDQTFYKSGDFPRIFIFVLVSFFGTFFYPPLLFIHIIDIVCNSEILANIFQAIALGVESILYVSFMGVVFVIIFNTVTFSNYMKNVYEDESVEDMCDGMVSCIMDLYLSGVIIETMDKFEMLRFIYDTIYSIFFGMMFQNIVSGIILDAFGELRQINGSLSDDKSNKCYICNIDRQILQKKGQSFDEHIQGKHFLWNYIFYIICLQEKNQTDYTGLQYYISTKYKRPDQEMDVSWIPNGEDAEFDGNEIVCKLLDDIDKVNENLADPLKSVEQKIDEFMTTCSELQK